MSQKYDVQIGEKSILQENRDRRPQISVTPLPSSALNHAVDGFLNPRYHDKRHGAPGVVAHLPAHDYKKEVSDLGKMLSAGN